MSHTMKLPQGHPLIAAPVGLSPFEVADRMIAFRRGWSGGLSMKDPADGGDDDDPEDEGDDPLELEPDDVVSVGGKTMKVSELQRIAAKEKREGKRAGQKSLLEALGFESVDEAKEALKGAKPPKKKTTDDPADDEAAERARAREAAAEERERKAAAKERRTDLRGALRDHGVARTDLDDAFAILDRQVGSDYDEDDIEEAVEAMQTRRPALFGETDDGKDDDKVKQQRPPRGEIPRGGPKRRNTPPPATFGSAGLERARQKGWIKSGSDA